MSTTTFAVPRALHEVFGERQTKLEVLVTLLFAATVSVALLGRLWEPAAELALWRKLLGAALVVDIVAGCGANFTRGTNEFYASRPGHRWGFIAIHVHLIAVAWLLEGDLVTACVAWGYTIASASIVHVLRPPRQVFVGGVLLAGGLVLLLALPGHSPFMQAVSALFVLKVVFAFAVDHYPTDVPR